MIDIHFYMKVYDLKKKIMNGERFDREYVFNKLEECRRTAPVVYNIETTNACNMRCQMCPRTTMMTRKVERLGTGVFEKIIEEFEPFSAAEWEEWQRFVEKSYHIDRNDMSENHYFLHVIPKVIQLHGYGDPLLDTEMPNRIKQLSARGFTSYFSCNPANIDVEKNIEMFKNGLGYIKYSIESVDDFLHKKIRGDASNFEASFQKIKQMLAAKKKYDLGTTIVITMLDLKRDDQEEEFAKLRQAFERLDVYIYMKSQDQQWYQGKDEGTNSLHWTEFCQFPWSSMTIKSNGEAAMCVEDFNNEIILGDTRKETLTEIWNGEKYGQFRRAQFDLKKGIKCTEQCDMKLVGGMCL
ncbi:MAG: SPASM domain-containing protein [Proteobacteria bacterium]|nr:SPASM domain-containing protein [Pseudomonadota bacterium]MBU1710263.1 SPASM domain-containing protein [Pseudomonadota bacterium]